jgi:transcriptional regulator with XRE-family HTH domain
MKPQYSSRPRRVLPKVRNEIRRYRLQLGLTQSELARRLGVQLSTVSSWERGLTCPAASPLLRLAKTLSTLAEGLYPDFYLVRHADEAVTSPAA